MSTASLTEIDRARRDPVVFADVMIGQPLWPHQVDVIRSSARYRCLCAGRRAGKTRVFGVLSLHQAFAVPHSKVFIVSASDTSAKRMFADISSMATNSPHLRVSLDEETSHLMTLSNGSTIECVPSSMKAVRSAEADLLIVDEAGFVDQSIWEAAEPVVGARPGARVLIASTPWGAPEHFFRSLWQQGMTRPDSEVASWHWPTVANPNVDLVWLEGVRGRSSSEYFRREYEAEWTDESGAYFSEAEIMAAVAPYRMLDLQQVADQYERRTLPAVGGVDWGMARDANVLALLSPLDDCGMNADLLGHRDRALFVPFIEGRSNWPYSQFLERIVEVSSIFDVMVIASETNGVGAYPTEDLRLRLHKAIRGGRLNTTIVSDVWTDVRRKQTGFGKMKALMQSGRLVLPPEPELLKQLRGLQFEQLPSGSLRIAVPENLGHDDRALAILQALSAIEVEGLRGWDRRPGREPADVVSTSTGLRLPAVPLPDTEISGLFARYAAGAEQGDGW